MRPARWRFLVATQSPAVPRPPQNSAALILTSHVEFPMRLFQTLPLEQAIAQSAEAGLRGNVGVLGGVAQWSLAAYQTRIDDDILFVASPKLIGTGYFQNAGNTRRAGLDLRTER